VGRNVEAAFGRLPLCSVPFCRLLGKSVGVFHDFLSSNFVQMIGLRNEGYLGTRHNVGEGFVDNALQRLRQLDGVRITNWSNMRKIKCEIASVVVPVSSLLPSLSSPQNASPAAGKAATRKSSSVSELQGNDLTVEVVLCKPNGFINESGGPVVAAVQHLKPDAFCVAHDGELCTG
jgi:peptidyl-tRNA hydrolase